MALMVLFQYLYELGKTKNDSTKRDRGHKNKQDQKQKHVSPCLELSCTQFHEIPYQPSHVHGKPKPALSKFWAGELHD
jgi:hypothetical protein